MDRRKVRLGIGKPAQRGHCILQRALVSSASARPICASTY
jgi:hypothetical protein